jgi:DNA-binding transcriptional MerR regulator
MPDGAALSIGDLARQAGTKVETIRYYEKIGLMPASTRTSGNHRAYTPTNANRLAFIRHSRELGFPLDSIRTLLDVSDDANRSCSAVDAIASQHLAAVRGRIARLQVLEAELTRMLHACRRGRIAECRIIEVLANQNHAPCSNADHHGTGL